MELTDFGRFVKKIANEKRHKTISAKIKQEKNCGNLGKPENKTISAKIKPKF